VVDALASAAAWEFEPNFYRWPRQRCRQRGFAVPDTGSPTTNRIGWSSFVISIHPALTTTIATALCANYPIWPLPDRKTGCRASCRVDRLSAMANQTPAVVMDKYASYLLPLPRLRDNLAARHG